MKIQKVKVGGTDESTKRKKPERCCHPCLTLTRHQKELRAGYISRAGGKVSEKSTTNKPYITRVGNGKCSFPYLPPL